MWNRFRLEQLRVSLSLKISNVYFRALADVLYIYPFKSDKKTFDQDKDELGFATKTKVAKKKKTAEDIEREREEYLEEER